MTDNKNALSPAAQFDAQLLALTDDAQELISALKNDPDGLWRSYLEQEAGTRDLSNDVANWILNTQRRFYPGRSLNDYTMLLVRMRDLVEPLAKNVSSSGQIKG
jgi:hypothetical protein